jgi:hypothetical protein
VLGDILFFCMQKLMPAYELADMCGANSS